MKRPATLDVDDTNSEKEVALSPKRAKLSSTGAQNANIMSSANIMNSASGMSSASIKASLNRSLLLDVDSELVMAEGLLDVFAAGVRSGTHLEAESADAVAGVLRQLLAAVNAYLAVFGQVREE